MHAANGDQGARVYRFLRDELGATFIQFIPIIERATPETLEVANAGWGDHVKGRPLYTQTGELVTDRSIGPEQYGRFLIDVFEDWVRHDIGRVYVQMFDTALANWVGEPAGMCVHAETCGLQLALEHNGDLYCCDHFVEPDYLLGNITETPMQQLIASSKQRSSARTSATRSPGTASTATCASPATAAAPRTASRPRPTARPGQHYLCPGYKAFFHHVDRPMRIDGRPARGRPRAGRADAGLRHRGRPPRPQRPLHVRQRPQMEALPRSQLLSTAGGGRWRDGCHPRVADSVAGFALGRRACSAVPRDHEHPSPKRRGRR